MTPRNIELRIDGLILSGLPSVDGLEVAEAVERELERLLAVQGLPSALKDGGDVGRLSGHMPEIARTSSPSEIGGQIAQAVCQTIQTKRTQGGMQ
jgi:hypothetical protein